MLKISQIWKNILLETEAKTTTLAYELYINTLEPIGIFMTFLEMALESEGYAFTRELHPDTDGKKRVLTATYTISK